MRYTIQKCPICEVNAEGMENGTGNEVIWCYSGHVIAGTLRLDIADGTIQEYVYYELLKSF